MSVEQSCRKLRRDTPLFFRCAAIVSLLSVVMDSLPGNVSRPPIRAVAGLKNEKSNSCSVEVLRAAMTGPTSLGPDFDYGRRRGEAGGIVW